MELAKMLEKNCKKLIFDCNDNELYEGILKTVDEIKQERKYREPEKSLEEILVKLELYGEVQKILGEYGKNISNVLKSENNG